MDERTRVAVVCTHVIQHFPPLFRGAAKDPHLTLRVFYASSAGLRPYVDQDFGATVAWDSDLTGGYDHEFLPGASVQLRPGFWGALGSRLNERLSAFGPDVIFVFGYTPALMLRAAAYGIARGIPVAMMTDSELLHERPGWRRVVKQLVLPRLLRRVSAFLTVGDNNEAYLRHYGVDSHRLIRGGIPTDEAAFLAARENRVALRARVRAQWGLEQDDFVLLCVGKLIARKRPQDVLAAAARIAHPARPIAVVYAGDGQMRAELELAAKSAPAAKVRFLGFVNQSALPGTYAGADALVHPAEIDAHPLTITEATMVGIPVLVSDRVGAIGPTDTAQPGRNATVYPVGDTAALAAIIERIAGDPVVLRHMADATIDVARQTGLSACVEGFARVVERARASTA